MTALSWRFSSDQGEACPTRRGGHLAPVTFTTSHGPIQPYAIAPWADERLSPDTPDKCWGLCGQRVTVDPAGVRTNLYLWRFE